MQSNLLISIPPEREYEAFMRVLAKAVIVARSIAEKEQGSLEHIRDLMDAVHNIPGLLMFWDGHDQYLRYLPVKSLSDYEEKWGNSDVWRFRHEPCLYSMYQKILSENDDG